MRTRVRFATIMSFLVLTATLSQAQTINPDVDTWLSIPPPKEDFLRKKAGKPYQYSEPGVAHYVANYSDCEWEVLELRDRASARRINNRDKSAGTSFTFEIPAERSFAGHRTAIRVEDGWLIGFNAGESGGSLWWFSKDGKDRYEKYQTIRSFNSLRWPANYMPLQDLDRMSISRGEVIKLITKTLRISMGFA